MKKLGFITIFRAPITLGKELSSNKKDKLPNVEREGVYSLKCGDCGKDGEKFENSDERTFERF